MRYSQGLLTYSVLDVTVPVVDVTLSTSEYRLVEAIRAGIRGPGFLEKRGRSIRKKGGVGVALTPPYHTKHKRPRTTFPYGGCPLMGEKRL